MSEGACIGAMLEYDQCRLFAENMTQVKSRIYEAREHSAIWLQQRGKYFLCFRDSGGRQMGCVTRKGP